MGVYSALEGEFDYEIVEEFLSHFTIMSDSLERLIIGLKHEEKYLTNINEIFRIFHNIKSATAYLKITPIHKLVTLGEEILEECRLVEGKGSEALINWLILVSDQLGRYREDLENDAEDYAPLNHLIIKVPTKFIQ
jgi:two-component system chemotaxis sensor kinase CheA